MATLLELRTRVRDDLDMDDDAFIKDSDLNNWINVSIRKAESLIHTLYEDYFQTKTSEPIVSGTKDYDYPSDLFANKIRKIMVDNGGQDIWEMKRVNSANEAEILDKFVQGDTRLLKWSPINSAASGRKIRVHPTPAQSGTFEIWYLRNALQLSADSDVLDIDEFEEYIVQSTKTLALLKDGNPLADDSKVLEKELERLMIETLSRMVPDDNNDVQPDMSIYEDHT